MLKKISIILVCLLSSEFALAQCQSIVPSITPNSTPSIEIDPDNGQEVLFYDICQGESITFEGDALFPENNTNYEQTIASSTFTWTNNGGNVQTGISTTYTFANAGGYEVVLNVEDVNACANLIIVKVFIRVSTTPEINLSADPLTVCPTMNSELEALIEFTPTTWYSYYNNIFSEELFIPDGPACPPGAYQTEIEFNSFLPNQTLTDVNDFLRVCIDMEHSYLGDIMINLHAPNGSTVVLLEDQNGIGSGNGMGGEGLGLPENNDSFDNACSGEENPAGTGYTYCWSPNPSTGSLQDLNNSGQLQNPVQESVIAGNTNIFSAYNNSFNNLVNSPLNGTWAVEVIDTYNFDNGWIFQWWIDFNVDLLPSYWSFTPSIESGEWQESETTVVVNGNSMTINPPIPGIYEYEYTLVDNFGCEYSDFVEIEAINGVELQTNVNIPDECTQAIGSATIEGIGGLEPYTYSWPTLGFSGQTAGNLNSGTYPYTITDAQGCVFEGLAIVDQVGLEVELELLESSDDICELGYGEMLVAPISGSPPYSYDWANSNSTSALGTNLFTGLQTVVATDVNGCTGDFSYFIGNIPPPEAEFSYYLDSCTFELTLTDETDGAIYSHWEIGTNLTSSQTTTSLHLTPGLAYPITLISSIEYCSDSVVQTVDLTLSSVLDRIKFPNVFTPNNDFINDYFTIKGLKYCDKGSLRIFNRWGEEVYYTLHPEEEPWNGKKQGLEVSEGAYFYVLDLTYTKLKGVLNLYR